MAILNRHNDSPVFVCISKGEYQRVSGAGIRPFYVFILLHLLCVDSNLKVYHP